MTPLPRLLASLGHLIVREIRCTKNCCFHRPDLGKHRILASGGCKPTDSEFNSSGGVTELRL